MGKCADSLDLVRRRTLTCIDSADEMKTWADGSWLFPKLVRLLGEPAYMDDILLGFVLSIGSRGEGVVSKRCGCLFQQCSSWPADATRFLQLRPVRERATPVGGGNSCQRHSQDWPDKLHFK